MLEIQEYGYNLPSKYEQEKHEEKHSVWIPPSRSHTLAWFPDGQPLSIVEAIEGRELSLRYASWATCLSFCFRCERWVYTPGFQNTKATRNTIILEERMWSHLSGDESPGGCSTGEHPRHSRRKSLGVNWFFFASWPSRRRAEDFLKKSLLPERWLQKTTLRLNKCTLTLLHWKQRTAGGQGTAPTSAVDGRDGGCGIVGCRQQQQTGDRVRSRHSGWWFFAVRSCRCGMRRQRDSIRTGTWPIACLCFGPPNDTRNGVSTFPATVRARTYHYYFGRKHNDRIDHNFLNEHVHIFFSRDFCLCMQLLCVTYYHLRYTFTDLLIYICKAVGRRCCARAVNTGCILPSSWSRSYIILHGSRICTRSCNCAVRAPGITSHVERQIDTDDGTTPGMDPNLILYLNHEGRNDRLFCYTTDNSAYVQGQSFLYKSYTAGGHG